MEERSYKVYKFDELSDKAKEKAREWYREASQHDEWWDATYEDAKMCADRLGITFKTQTRTAINSKTHARREYQETCLFFSGFSSQGDGACFEGNYGPVENALEAIKDHAPVDGELHRIGRNLQIIQDQNGKAVIAMIKHRGHYNHSGCMDIDVERSDGEELADGAADAVTQLLRDFADWIYKQLRTEYDWRQADEQVDENIKANDYAFLGDGTRDPIGD